MSIDNATPAEWDAAARRLREKEAALRAMAEAIEEYNRDKEEEDGEG